MILLKVLTVLFVLSGILGTFLPILPGSPLIVIGALIYGYSTDFSILTVRDLLILVGLSVLAEGVDYFFSLIGAKKFGASKAGLFGGIIGVFLGLITLGPIGIFVGPFFGAIVLEVFFGRPINQAIKIGVGSVIGVLGGMVMTFIISLAMGIWVIIKII